MCITHTPDYTSTAITAFLFFFSLSFFRGGGGYMYCLRDMQPQCSKSLEGMTSL